MECSLSPQTCRRARRVGRALVIVMFGAGGDGWGDRAFKGFGRVRDSGAVLYALLFVPRDDVLGVALANETQAERLIGDGAQQSGGRRQFAGIGQDNGCVLNEFADDWTHQYAIRYVLPGGVRPSARIKVSLSRPTAILRAPTRVPER